MATVYTIGYGGRKFEDFISILSKYGVVNVVDVRRFPKSKFPEFDVKSLEVELPKRSMGYVNLGGLLGGFRRGGYEDYTKTPEYGEGLKKLIELLKRGNLALICVERSPKGCHRRFIASTLEGLGIKIIHIV